MGLRPLRSPPTRRRRSCGRARAGSPRPRSSQAITESSSAIAGMPPVSPAAMTGSRRRRARHDRRLARAAGGCAARPGRARPRPPGSAARRAAGCRESRSTICQCSARSAGRQIAQPVEARAPRSPPCRAAGRGVAASAAAWPGSSGRSAASPRSNRAPAGSAAAGGAARGSPAALRGLGSSAPAPSASDSSSRIEVADRPQPRQQQRRPRVAALGVSAQKRLAQGAHRAPGRQQHGHARQAAAGRRRPAPSSPAARVARNGRSGAIV